MLLSDAYRIYHLLQHTRQSKNRIERLRFVLSDHPGEKVLKRTVVGY